MQLFYYQAININFRKEKTEMKTAASKKPVLKNKSIKKNDFRSPYAKEILDNYISLDNDKGILSLHVVAIFGDGSIHSDTLLATNAIHKFAMVAKLEQDVSEIKVIASQGTFKEDLL